MTSTQAAEINARYRDAEYLSSHRADNQSQVRTCDCCGAGLWNINLARLADGEVVALGTDCAERVGLDDTALKAWWADKYAAQRDAKRAAKAAARRAEWDAIDAARAAELAAAPPAPFRGVTNPQQDITYAEALFDLDGNPLNARLVSGQYGRTWLINPDTTEQDWFSPSRAQDPERARKANAKKGYYVGTAGYRTAGSGRRTWADTTEAPITIEDNGQLTD